MNGKKNKVLIIGGTSGIGKACALKFKESGYQVFVCARSQTKLQSLKSLLSDEDILFSFDVTKSEVPEEMKQFYDVVIYSAGFSKAERFLDNKLDTHLDLVETHLSGYIKALHIFLPF
ncbi:MAG: SDR family NAD(P)-dependent oxidoreductase, partial [Halobacteriovoraceae bacterium]|nr:SDR family NAD(P)-dependent oxidoreductase [Halobacteriovoraceae bacterium]